MPDPTSSVVAGVGQSAPGLAARVGVALFVTLLVSVFDVVLAGHVVAAWRTRAYVETEGRILASVVTKDWRHHSRPQHGIALEYEYTAQGRTLRGSRYGANDPGTSTGSWAKDLVASLPPGKVVPVFFDPQNPRLAVLVRGVQGGDLLWPLLLVPFNLMAFGLWSGVALVLRARREDRPYVDPKTLGRWAAGLIVTGIAALVLMIIVGILFGLEPDLRIAAAAWGATLLSGVVAFVRVHRRSGAEAPSVVAASTASSRR